MEEHQKRDLVLFIVGLVCLTFGALLGGCYEDTLYRIHIREGRVELDDDEYYKCVRLKRTVTFEEESTDEVPNP